MDGGKRFVGGMRGPRRLEAPTAARHDIPSGSDACMRHPLCIDPALDSRPKVHTPAIRHNPSPLDDCVYAVRLLAPLLRVARCGNVVVLMPAFWQ
jgi:hypothetical protein